MSTVAFPSAGVTSKPRRAPADNRLYTPEDLLALPDAVTYELEDGRLVERGMGTESSWIGGTLYRVLRDFCDRNRLGWCLPADASYKCFPDAPLRVRKPDVSFIRFGRLPGEQLPLGHTPIPPDLAVEVLSPRDLAYRIERKVKEYLSVGVLLVWVINPDTRRVRLHRGDRSIVELTDADDLSGEQVIPGFRVRVADLFPPQAAAGAPAAVGAVAPAEGPGSA